jgi:two-component system, OmpR family, aerobic respiration control sensor histidine kinase ArcB
MSSTDKKLHLQAKEVAFNALFDLFPINFSWMDTKGYVLGCNRRVLGSLHLHTFEDIIGKHTVEIASELAWQNTQKVLKTGKSLSAEEVHLNKDGTKTYFLSLKSPIQSVEGETLGVVNIAIDITDRKLMEIELEESKQAAQYANKAKSEFLMNMRHDIRTPLTGIIGFANLIKDASKDAEITEYAQHMLASSEELLDFLNEILEIVHLTSGKTPLLKKKFDLQAILLKLMDLHKAKAEQKKLALSLDYDPAIPSYLIGDPRRIQKILLELLSNALNFTHEGSVHISVKLAKETAETTIIKILVSDTGEGIPEDKKEEIFYMFNRLHPAYEGIHRGIGLGLTIAKQFIDDLKGEFYVESTLGSGSTFACILPFKKVLLDDDFGIDDSLEKLILLAISPHHTKHVLTHENTVSENTRRILLVEDNQIAAMVTKNMLIQLGCLVDVAEDGQTALTQFNATQYDLIFMDVGLPDLSGYQVTERIRDTESSRDTHTPILALTAHVEADEKQACIAAGMDAVYLKPLHKKTAVAILDAFLPKKITIKSTKPNNWNVIGEVIDFNASIQLTGKDAVFAKEMLTLLVGSFPEELKTLQKAHEQNDWDLIQSLTHRLKGGTVYCGTPRLTLACTHLDQYLHSGKVALREKLYQQILQEIENVKMAFAKV